MKIMKYLRNQVYIYWLFIKNDIWATIIPGVIIALVAFSHYSFSLTGLILILLKAVLYFNLYAYTFVLTNQINSIEEDKVNKPYRPLVSGLVEKSSMAQRIILATFIFLVVGYYFGVFEWALLWVIISIFHNYIGHKHWFLKNTVCMTLGIFAIIGAGWGLVSEPSSSQLVWGFIVSLIFGITGVIQDFRDEEGDRIIGRRTLPLSFGDYKSRFISVGLCILSNLLFVVYIVIPSPKTVLNNSFSIVTLFLFCLICFRLIRFREKKADHNTYMILLFTFNWLLLSGISYI